MPARKTAPEPSTPTAKLWNLSETTAAWLAELDIHTHAELAAADLVAVWLTLEASHRQVTRLMYYAMWGAVHNCHWRAVPDSAKAEFERRIAEVQQ